MFARFNENPAMTLQDIKETKRYGRTDGRTHGHTDTRTHGRTDNVKTVYPLQTKFAGGIIIACNKNYFSYFSTKTYVVGTQKNRLNETALLSTPNKCLN